LQILNYFSGYIMPSKKKCIVFVANTSWSIYKFRLYLLQELIKNGYTIYVLAPRDKYTPLFQNTEGLIYIELLKLKSSSISPFMDIAFYKELLYHYRRIKPDLIFHYTIKANIYGSLAASRIRCPSVSVITGLGYTFTENGFLKIIVGQLYRYILKKNTEVWFLNTDDQFLFIKSKLVTKEKTFLLPGEGVDTTTFYPAPYKINEKPVTFLLMSRIIEHKGVYEFVKAAEILQYKKINAQFQLLGFFDEKNPVAIAKKQVQQWAENNIIKYLGETDNVVPFIEQADCIVLPSYREGMPLSLLEAASMCKAIIASDVPGCREIIINNVNGFLCKKKDATDLAAKMEKYYLLPAEEKKKMGIAGRNLIHDHFTKEITIQTYLFKIDVILKNNLL
jgi:glycosyltransferase involved in cell wall biosynthesis